jgi:transposase InsO family protein
MSPATLTEPWKNVSADFIVGLPMSQGFDALLVVVDHAKKQMHAVPTTMETSALGLAKLYQDNVWRYHGLPNSIISDQGPQFAAELMKELNKLLGIQTKLSTAYHPQTDGQTERMNQEVEQYLRLFISHRQDDWAEWIAIAEFSYNNKIHSLTKVSPFYANYGYHPRMGTELHWYMKVEAADEFAT